MEAGSGTALPSRSDAPNTITCFGGKVPPAGDNASRDHGARSSGGTGRAVEGAEERDDVVHVLVVEVHTIEQRVAGVPEEASLTDAAEAAKELGRAAR